VGWRDLLQQDEVITVPWTGGRAVRRGPRTFQIQGGLPPEHGFHEFTVSGGRRATWKGPSPMTADQWFDERAPLIRGYLLGDRLAPDGAAVVPDLARLVDQTELVHLVEPGLDRYARIAAARDDDGHLIYVRQEFPLGPEDAVRTAFLDRKPSIDHVPGVTPALDLLFRLESFQREEVIRRRAELERLRLQREEEERQAEIRERHHRMDRRVLARQSFEDAARAALAVTGAELLDERPAYQRGEHVVQFRFRGRRFECVADEQLRIIDSGICLIDHETGEKGDTRFTLESLPGVISQAMDEGVLVVFRHVGGEEDD